MKERLLLTLAITGALACKSQTVTPVVLSNQGGFSQLTNGSISWSIGEPVSESYTNGTKITTMGFHQPELNFVTLMTEQGSEGSVLVFPNPVKDVLNVNFAGLKEGNYKLELIDNLGKLISRSETELTKSNQSVQLKISEVAAGNYFLRVDSKDFSKTVKINKIN